MKPARGRRGTIGVGVLLVAVLLALLVPVVAVRADEPRLLLGTTVGLERTGLLASLLPRFEQQTGRKVTVVAVSPPQALALGVRGEVEALLIDATDDEPGYVAAGHAIDRRLVMHADEVILGPRSDPAGAASAPTLGEALQRIAQSGSSWVSRADNSGLFRK